MQNKITESVSFHIVKPCNMACKFCYDTFNDSKNAKQLLISEVYEILGKLKSIGVRKVTFAGGEPMLYKHLYLAIIFAKKLGFTTSIITNGSLLTEEWLQKMQNYLDWVGISIDSIMYDTNIKSGRNINGVTTSYQQILPLINQYKYKLKINTVVNHYNKNEDLSYLIEKYKPLRWKIFQALPVKGQNDEQFEEVRVTIEEFNSFVERHSHLNPVVENNEAMLDSYLLIDYMGRFFEGGKEHKYSDSILNNDVEKCLSQISHNKEMFIKRGGIYNW